MKQSSSANRTMAPGSRGWRAATVLAGTVAAGTQIVLLRETISIFLGNELVVGIMLFDWLALTGLGALLVGRRASRLRASTILPLVAGSLMILPPLTLYAFRVLPLLVAPAGSMLEIWIVLAGAILIMCPVCMASGAAFALLVQAATSAEGAGSAGTVYGWEGLGSLAGGALFGVLLFNLVSSRDLLFVLCGLAGFAGAVMALAGRERLLAALLITACVALAVSRWLVDVDAWCFRQRYPGHALLQTEETPFGILTVTRLGDQTNVFVNNAPAFVEGDVQHDEETVHPVLAQRTGARRVLLAGGNPAGLIPEILKYPGSSVISIEENPWLRTVQEKYVPLPRNGQVEYRVEDVRHHLLSPGEYYHAVILVVPEPSSLQSNRMYTRELLELAHRRLSPGGVICLSLPSSADYAGEDAKNVRAILRTTLENVFANVRMLPLGRDLFLASDSTLRVDVGAAIAEAGVATVYANGHYIQDDLLAARSERMTASLPRSAALNSDSRPALMLAQIRYWMRFFSVESWVPALIFVAALLALIRTERASFGLMSAGCGGIVLELMVLMIVQTAYGNVYMAVGALIGLYMAGMSAGAFLAGRWKLTPRAYGSVQSALAAAILLASFLQPAASMGSSAAVAGLAFCLLLGSLSAGAVFTLTARGPEQVVRGSHLYAVDLLGSAAGALVAGPFLLPMLGVHTVAGAASAFVVLGTVVTLTSPVWRLHEEA